MNPIFLIDFYKVGHIKQYPSGITKVWSNWTPRYSRIPGRDGAIHFGLQYLIQKYLLDEFYENFFERPTEAVISEYEFSISNTLGPANTDSTHIRALHNLGYLPIEIYSVPEGTFVPSGVPALVITNTLPEFFWLPNYLETLLSAVLWGGSTSATTASVFKGIFLGAAKEFGEKDLSFTNWQGHDFSMRGLMGTEASQISGMGHLTSFSGTDTLPAILAATHYYKAAITIGGSVPATEHSVACAGGMDGEFETFRRLIVETYPTGILSLVSDTWDLWKVLTDYVPRLKAAILARDGKVVFRPDSGNPVEIMIGKPSSSFGPERAGVLKLLAEAMGVDNNGHINKVGTIYGDGISPDRARRILQGAIDHNLSPYNVVLGIGSYSYQYVTRDTYGFAMKATAVEKGGKVVPIFKDPVTDDGGKKSHFGIPCAYWERDGLLHVKQNSLPGDLDGSSGFSTAFNKVFRKSEPLNTISFAEIRQNVENNKYQ